MLEKKDVERAANLSMIELPPDKIEEYTIDFNSSLKSLEPLIQKDADGFKQLIYLGQQIAVLRDDEIKNSLEQELLFENAPQVEDDYFIVPKVVE